MSVHHVAVEVTVETHARAMLIGASRTGTLQSTGVEWVVR
jgi:hypothetical protein